MGIPDTTAHLVDHGVAFTVTVDFQQHACLISGDALSSIDHSIGASVDLLAIYYAHHTRINGVARRLVAAGSRDTPVLLSARNFA